MFLRAIIIIGGVGCHYHQTGLDLTLSLATNFANIKKQFIHNKNLTLCNYFWCCNYCCCFFNCFFFFNILSFLIAVRALSTLATSSTSRLFLREFAIEMLRSAYNTLIRQVRRVLERNSSGHDDSYLLWAIRFFMEFNRLSGFQLPLVRYVYLLPTHRSSITIPQMDRRMGL